MKNFIGKFLIKRRYLIMDETEVLNVVETINSHEKLYIDPKIDLGNCGFRTDPTKWFIFFTASKEQWKRIVRDLHIKGFKMVIRDDSNDVYLIKED